MWGICGCVEITPLISDRFSNTSLLLQVQPALMANRKQYFFYAPSWDYPPPPAGPIRLGNVITSLTSPERPLHTAVPTESEVFSVRKSSVETSTQVDRHTKVAIVTKFLSILGLGVDAGINLETRYFSLLIPLVSCSNLRSFHLETYLISSST